jgi:hypothetical protein
MASAKRYRPPDAAIRAGDNRHATQQPPVPPGNFVPHSLREGLDGWRSQSRVVLPAERRFWRTLPGIERSEASRTLAGAVLDMLCSSCKSVFH